MSELIKFLALAESYLSVSVAFLTLALLGLAWFAFRAHQDRRHKPVTILRIDNCTLHLSDGTTLAVPTWSAASFCVGDTIWYSR